MCVSASLLLHELSHVVIQIQMLIIFPKKVINSLLANSPTLSTKNLFGNLHEIETVFSCQGY